MSESKAQPKTDASTPQSEFEISLSPAHAMMAKEMGVEAEGLAMAAQKVLENQYEQYDAQRRQQAARQAQDVDVDVDDQAVQAASEELSR